ncbi:hypothetical protein [Calothrix sp. PCC 6303]|uniref:hypothetical protein n=1 Tax=Calothrix sp. PCC 6303 TaxID=1170562 RepID=UPI000309B48F|nr:hypothetical protein [Calothrix sp. PCC 6303]
MELVSLYQADIKLPEMQHQKSVISDVLNLKVIKKRSHLSLIPEYKQTHYTQY